MPSDYDNDLLHQAVLNIKSNEFPMARHYLELAIELADDRETLARAHYWMSQISADPLEQRKHLEQVLGMDPTHPEARKALAVLDGKLKPGDIINPDALPSQSTETKQAVADRFTCPQCGARMVFDGDGSTLLCEHCAHKQGLNHSAPRFEQDFILAMTTGKGHRTPVAQSTFNCHGCGAQFLLSPQQISANCVYCGSPHVEIVTKELVKPDSIVPMAFNQPEARQYITQWRERHKIELDKKSRDPQGLYLPVWTFDIFGLIPWNGTLYRDKKRIQVSGEQDVSFNDIVIPAAHRWPGLLEKLVVDLDTANAPAYDPGFLSGWPAEVYSLTMAEASLDARQRVVGQVRNRIFSEKGNVEDLNYSTANISVLAFKLALVPVWVSSYSSEGKEFPLLVNGQTGKVYGEARIQGLGSWLADIFST